MQEANASPATETKTLADGIQEQLARCRQLLVQYNDPMIRPVAGFAIAHIEADIRRTEKAILEGDVVEMLRCYEALKDKR